MNKPKHSKRLKLAKEYIHRGKGNEIIGGTIFIFEPDNAFEGSSYSKLSPLSSFFETDNLVGATRYVDDSFKEISLSKNIFFS